MDIRKLIRETIESVVKNDTIPASSITKDYLMGRIPFLKEYPTFQQNERGMTWQKEQYNPSYTAKTKDPENDVTFSPFNLFSTFSFYTNKYDRVTTHGLRIKNEIIGVYKNNPLKDETENSLMRTIINAVERMTNEKNSAYFELFDYGSGISKTELDAAINEINGKIFKFGEAVSKMATGDFLTP